MVHVIAIKNEDQSGTLLASGLTFQNGIPEIVFLSESFKITPRPRWVVKRVPQREGNFTFYNGSDDDTMPVAILLRGSNRETNLTTIKGLKDDVLYLDTNSNFSFADGKWIMETYEEPIESISGQYIYIRTNWRKYNNT